ncbi:hypothetical protein [Limoniibacter endophyticus]|uniref:Uncharacterized protein n=1 Tax=Limoniibacter endophyticus TaxID=1565040 RepID=A0A8J3DKK7_9HYPH|nr:hypothetical protein [Limoniibacter endophyticus]GHC77116.1 hypothetical protein GCM10010136_28410 [Limoniibacter endophyticus]
MSKVASLLFFIAMVIQVIRPIGLPGLKKRGDFWKIALFAIFAVSLTAVLRPGGH